jgi:tellurite resistance protein
MAQDDQISYLANIICVATADGRLSAREQQAMEGICRRIGAEQHHMEQAIQVVTNGGYQPIPVGCFSDRVRNLEDMVYMALSDDDLPDAEKMEILSFAKKIHVTQGQINEIVSEAKKQIQTLTVTPACPTCGKVIPSQSLFCIHCGSKIDQDRG